jgi:topoisomerase IV subunit B
MIMTQSYNESSIQILEGLSAVRKRPGMYIGSSDHRGLHHLVWEILDNAIDEALNGYGNCIKVTLIDERTIRIEDEGRGMPTGMHSSGVSTLEVIFTKLHAGGKFSSSGGYKTSGGLHGVGASVVNALSSWLEVTSYHGGQMATMRFEKGGSKATPLLTNGKTTKKGSVVTFSADPLIFGNHVFNAETISSRLKESAYLLDHVTFIFTDERSKKVETFKFDHGLKQFVMDLNEDLETLHEPIAISGKAHEIEVNVSLQYNSGYNENIISFVNMVKTKDGGTHEVGFKSALTKVVNDFARKNGFLKDKDKNFEGVDIREGCSAIISLKIEEDLLQFEGQTKSKLGTEKAKSATETIVMEQLSYYFEEHRSLANELIKRFSKAASAREAARKARDEARQGKHAKSSSRALAGKLSPAQSKDKKRNELFLVEGDSAGGSAKQGRDSKFQAILPLRGKVLNTEKASVSDVMKNEELSSIIYALGAGVGSEFDVSDCAYDKVIIMTDADTDGAHIQILLLTFFYRYMRPLIEANKVYLACPPLYKVSFGKESAYAYDDQELAVIRSQKQSSTIQRYKGLGEMNADQLWETTMDPKSRSLLLVSIEDAYVANKKVSLLMGDKAHLRREWINDHVSFSLSEEEV